MRLEGRWWNPSGRATKEQPITIALYAVTLAMGGASIALSALGDLKTPFVLLAVGMFSAGVAGIDSLRE